MNLTTNGYGEFEALGGEEWTRLRLFDQAYDRLTKAELSRLPLGPRRVLEIGPGTGSTMQAVHDLWPSAEMFALGRDHDTARMLPPTCRWIEHDLDASLPDLEPFDLIIMRSVLHLIDRRAQIPGEVRPLLTSGGHLLVQTIDFGPVARRAGTSSIWRSFLLLGRIGDVETDWLADLANLLEAADIGVIEAHHDIMFDRWGGPVASSWEATIRQAWPILTTVSDEARLLSGLTDLRKPDWQPFPGLTSVIGRWSG